MESNNLLKDLSTVTTVSATQLNSLSDKCEDIISHYICDQSNVDSGIIPVNIGIGTLVFKVLSDRVEYEFIPKASLEKKIVDSVVEGKDYLEDSICDKIGERFLTIYKELL